MSNKFEDIRKKMEDLSKPKESSPFTAKKSPVTKSVPLANVPSPKNQASLAKTLEDKGQAEAQLSKKQNASDDGMWQGGEGIVTRRVREEAAKARALQSEKDAELARRLQQETEAEVRLHLQKKPSEAADAQAAFKLMQELDAKEKAARIAAEREDAEMARRLQQEEGAGVRLHFQDKPSEAVGAQAAVTLMQELDAKEKAARRKTELEDEELARQLQQEDEARRTTEREDAEMARQLQQEDEARRTAEREDAEMARQLQQEENAKPGAAPLARDKPKR